MNKKIVIAGGTGFVGSYLCRKFKEAGYEVIIISRQRSHISWNDALAIKKALENTEMLINLAGKSVDCRYNEKIKMKYSIPGLRLPGLWERLYHFVKTLPNSG